VANAAKETSRKTRSRYLQILIALAVALAGRIVDGLLGGVAGEIVFGLSLFAAVVLTVMPQASWPQLGMAMLIGSGLVVAVVAFFGPQPSPVWQGPSPTGTVIAVIALGVLVAVRPVCERLCK
jgi:hypothetical protein